MLLENKDAEPAQPARDRGAALLPATVTPRRDGADDHHGITPTRRGDRLSGSARHLTAASATSCRLHNGGSERVILDFPVSLDVMLK